ncbi:hypothetical protein SAMN05421505_14917 [Sinosporangium album]|uniref:Uncharacterized protein n=1 Tax=Sinosporangium album TaxID=504805 RepID=A0A1G8KBE5_9ACTN|nr:hypothetical protein [Sinosporangium album]SDI40717.1 hypothetical protein SAMN05421505_14917 [Sinosporangium album]
MDPISSLSRPYLYIWVEGARGTEPVEVAFVNPGAEPVTGDWHPAAWDADSVTAKGADARILIGPGGEVVLADGTYDAWVRVTGPVERPVLWAGQVPIT